MDIIVGDQQAILAARHPRVSYSRGICLDCTATTGIGNSDFALTPSLGNKLWVLGVRLVNLPPVLDLMSGGLFYVLIGSGRQPSASEMIASWERVILSYGGVKPAVRLQGLYCEVYFPMMRFFEGRALRLGLVIENFSDAVVMNGLAILEVSEG